MTIYFVKNVIRNGVQMEKGYYAIKIGNNVRDKIVTSWEECKEYVIGYKSIYKKFDDKKTAQSWLNSWTEDEIENELRWNEIHRFHRLKGKIEIEYGFPIPDYIIDEMINNNDYNNLCTLINLAVANNRISKKHAKIIKDSEYKKKCDTMKKINRKKGCKNENCIMECKSDLKQ